jgi:UDP-glucose 4-epimerase
VVSSQSEEGGRVLVLGGTGFIGSQIALAFRAAGTRVRTLARRPPADPFPHDAGMEFVLGRAEDEATLERALDGVGWVVHAVGCPPPSASADDFDVSATSVLGLDTLLEALRVRPGVGLTFVSSGGAVYGDVDDLPVHEDTRCRPISAYGLAKLMAEDSISAYSARYGVPARILRIANAYGPGQDGSSGQGVIGTFLRAAATGEAVPVFDAGRAVRDFVHVGDVAEAIVALPPALTEPQVLNVGGGVGHSVTQVLALVEDITGSRLHVSRQSRRPTDVSSIVLDVTRLKGLVSWDPRDLRTGLAQTWEYVAESVASEQDTLFA